MSLNSEWLKAMEELQAKHDKAFRKRKKIAKSTLFGKFEAVTIGNAFNKPTVYGNKAKLHKTYKRVGNMIGAVGSESLEVYQNGKY
jgi:hypothetical protein